MTTGFDKAGGQGEPDGLPRLTGEEISRYSRHLLLSEVGMAGQRKLKAARVLVVGTGGLGAPLALYLAAAGVGKIGLVDFDFVEASNLQRQIIHGTRDIDRPKVASAQDRLRGLNPDIEIVTHNVKLSGKNAEKIFSGYEIIADGTDNYPTRYLINDVCVFQKKPNVYASIFQFEGQATVFGAPGGPCYRCLYPSPPPPGLVPSCGEGGVMGVLPGILGCVQAAEVIKLIVGGAETLANRLLLVDAWRMVFNELRIDRDPGCPVCGQNPSVTEPIDYEGFCGLGQKAQDEAAPITAKELKVRLDKGDDLQVVDIREPHERTLYPFPGAKAMPFGQLVRRMGEFKPGGDLVFICKIGQRSKFAIRALSRAGYTGRMYNLEDGLAAWAKLVGGPDVPY
ncbi:MAG: molybdopterin-synthase adenylyltransferase MoeB [Deltaproteobacteria bacterium]|nr:molybdopterin-synthase adenylyltransferase MoeB [Deltaproteobacteria bacterium]